MQAIRRKEFVHAGDNAVTRPLLVLHFFSSCSVIHWTNTGHILDIYWTWSGHETDM